MYFTSVFCIATIDLTFLYERITDERSLEKSINKLIDGYNDKYKNRGVRFIMKEFMFYDEYRNKYKELSNCAGTDDIKCRDISTKHIDNLFIFVSLKNNHIDLEKYNNLNKNNTKIYTNIHSNVNLYNLTLEALEKYIKIFNSTHKDEKKEKNDKNSIFNNKFTKLTKKEEDMAEESEFHFYKETETFAK